MTDPAIVVDDLTKRYGARPVVDGLTFSVSRGECVALNQSIADCKEILDVVMEGNVKEWLA